MEYEVLCRRHFMRRMTSHAARAASVSPEVLPFDLDLCPVPLRPAARLTAGARSVQQGLPVRRHAAARAGRRLVLRMVRRRRQRRPVVRLTGVKLQNQSSPGSKLWIIS